MAGYIRNTSTSTNRPFNYAGLKQQCSDTIFSTRRGHKSKSLKFNIFLADYIRYTRTKTIEALKYSSLKRRCSDPIFSTSRDINRNRMNYIFFAGYFRYTSTRTHKLYFLGWLHSLYKYEYGSTIKIFGTWLTLFLLYIFNKARP